MPKPPPPPKPKRKGTFLGSMLDGVAFVVREAALPIPDTLIKLMKGKKKK